MSFGAVVALIAAYETWGARLGRLFHSGSISAAGARLFRRGRGDDGDRDLGHRAVRDPSFPPSRPLFAAGQRDRRADLSAMWTLPWGVVACLLMPFGLEQLGARADGLGHRRDDLDRAMGLRPAGQCVGDAAPADRTGCVLIVLGGLWLCLWHGRWRVWGLVGDRRRVRDDAADPPARHRARRFRPSAGGARGGRRITTSPPAPKR